MTRVLIADDHPVVREGVRRILQGATEVEVVGEVGRSDEVLDTTRGKERRRQDIDADPDHLAAQPVGARSCADFAL